MDAPDLSLSRVAFARLADGRIQARGTAEHLDYRRAGGRLKADQSELTLSPQPGTDAASFGLMHFTAPALEGEVANRRGSAWGGVDMDTERGDAARTERVVYENELVTSDTPVAARGPGYQVASQGLIARGDGSRVELVKGVRGTLQMGAAQ